jgi:hypothetical protein
MRTLMNFIKYLEFEKPKHVEPLDIQEELKKPVTMKWSHAMLCVNCGILYSNSNVCPSCNGNKAIMPSKYLMQDNN